MFQFKCKWWIKSECLNIIHWDYMHIHIYTNIYIHTHTYILINCCVLLWIRWRKERLFMKIRYFNVGRVKNMFLFVLKRMLFATFVIKIRLFQKNTLLRVLWILQTKTHHKWVAYTASFKAGQYNYKFSLTVRQVCVSQTVCCDPSRCAATFWTQLHFYI
jgi:hypothetical protein